MESIYSTVIHVNVLGSNVVLVNLKIIQNFAFRIPQLRNSQVSCSEKSGMLAI